MSHRCKIRLPIAKPIPTQTSKVVHGVNARNVIVIHNNLALRERDCEIREFVKMKRERERVKREREKTSEQSLRVKYVSVAY